MNAWETAQAWASAHPTERAIVHILHGGNVTYLDYFICDGGVARQFLPLDALTMPYLAQTRTLYHVRLSEPLSAQKFTTGGPND